MTPFDGAALVAMLMTLYPVVTPANFVRARAEQPSYFANGIIFGSKGDKLQLPDGRQFDCIFAAGGPVSGRRWICMEIDPNAPGAEDVFALSPGPLEPIDEQQVIFPGGDPSLESFITGELGPLDGAEGVLDGARDAVIVAADPIQLEGTYRALVEPAAAAHATLRAALDDDNPGDVIDRTNAHDPEIDAARGDYVTEEPGDGEPPDPGGPPGGGGDDDDGPPPREA